MNDKNENTKKSSFLLHKDKKEIVEALTDEQAGKVFKAIYKYANNKEESKLDAVSNIVFLMFKQMLDANDEKYMNVIERNRINGAKGGRPKKVENQENPKNPVGYLENPNKPKKADTDTDTDIDTDIKKEKIKKEKEYFANAEINSLFTEFINQRKKLKAVNSERAINTLINKLNKYDDETKYKMIENSIVNSWKDVYELKENKKTGNKEIIPEWFDKKIEKEEMKEEDLEDIMKELQSFR